MSIEKKDDAYLQKLVTAWEETYKKGQLSFWIMLSLRDNRFYNEEIRAFVQNITSGTVSCDEQSLYRALRKFYDIEIVDYELRKGNKGPERKYYFLTPLGKQLLENFTERNIRLFFKKEVFEMIKSK